MNSFAIICSRPKITRQFLDYSNSYCSLMSQSTRWEPEDSFTFRTAVRDVSRARYSSAGYVDLSAQFHAPFDSAHCAAYSHAADHASTTEQGWEEASETDTLHSLLAVYLSFQSALRWRSASLRQLVRTSFLDMFTIEYNTLEYVVYTWLLPTVSTRCIPFSLLP